MLEHLYDTILGIVYTDMPKKQFGDNKIAPYVYDRPVDGWYFGEKSLHPQSDVPIISVSGGRVNTSIQAFRTRTDEYNIKVKIYGQSKTKESSLRYALEFVRTAHEILKKHKFIWVCTFCPFTEKKVLSPEYYLNHPDISLVMQPYIAEATDKWQALWEDVNPGESAPPLHNRAGLASVALQLFWDDISKYHQAHGSWDLIPASSSVKQALSNLPNTYNLKSVYDRIASMIVTFKKPVVLLYNSMVDQYGPDDNEGKEQAVLYSYSFDLKMKELYKEIEFGPDNVPIVNG